MLISRSHRFLFVHIQKTAGTSIARALTDALPDAEGYLGFHNPVRFAETDLGGMFSSYFKVAFVRNPFDRLVSWYADISTHTRRLTEEEKARSGNYNLFRQYVIEHASSFDEFVTQCENACDRFGWKPLLANQVDWMTGTDGRLAMDFVGRFETLSSSFSELCARLGLDNVDLPHINPTPHGHYRDYYTPSTRAIVERRFRRDLQLFEYAF